MVEKPLKGCRGGDATLQLLRIETLLRTMKENLILNKALKKTSPKEGLQKESNSKERKIHQTSLKVIEGRTLDTCI